MSKKVIDLLNEARSRELLAISQYMIEHYELEDKGFGKLGDEIKATAIVEMKHAEALGERILFLGGTPTTKPEGEAKKGLSIEEMLDINIKLEESAIKMYNESAKACAEAGDMISKQLFESLLKDEEGHLDDFDTKNDLVKKMGDTYLITLLG